MKKYSVVLVGKHDPERIVTPYEGYIGDSKEDAEAEAKKWSQDTGRFGEYVRDYQVCVLNEEGDPIFCVPFKTLD